ncbi:MAG: bifunctional proline dehydrogenase/L-glutamate gamma-semialdehyde dehydrogenase PutA [Methylobacter sp.]
MSQKSLAELRNIINEAYLADEKHLIGELLYCVWARFALFRKPSPRPFHERRGGQQLHFAPLLNIFAMNGYDPAAINETAIALATSVRDKKNHQSAIEAFLQEYQLSSPEGIALMILAEALLRIPDAHTQDLLLQEKLAGVNWQSHLQHSDSPLVNLATRALLFAGDFEAQQPEAGTTFEQLLSRMGTPVVRAGVRQAMKHLALQFVYAESIREALQRADEEPMFLYSFDMLGEAALTQADAERYFDAYRYAIDALADASGTDLHANPGISVKLSALCPRYEPLQHALAVRELSHKLLALARAARKANIMLTIDAEESERLDMSLDVFAAVFTDADLGGWPGLGLAVQAYQKRALPVIRWLARLAKTQRRKIPLRLVKGAYWDSEIKRAQELGLADYPVFIRKSATDVSYLACAQCMLSEPDAFYPQFATHNAHTVAAINLLGQHHPGYEFQRLHGMGETLYREIIEARKWNIPCRVYAPVGVYHELLPYLVRRLLENGANTSFINRISRPDVGLDDLVRDPVAAVKAPLYRPAIVLPGQLFGEQRLNSSGLNLADPGQRNELQQKLNWLAGKHWRATPLVNGSPRPGDERAIVNPSDNRLTVGSVVFADEDGIEEALDGAAEAYADWRLCPVETRADCLNKAADLFEVHRVELVSLCVREGGRTIKDALAEVREAVDFCRYYAQSALDLFGAPIRLPGPTGEENRLYYYGRGVFVCISPWNFPISIFVGQIVAALVSGNTVVAKPASQTALVAMRCVQLLHEAGVPAAALQFVPADGGKFGKQVLPDPRVAGVVMTGSTATARTLNRQLAEHRADIVPLIAETGGQNVLIADSSALPEQLAQDAIVSAFNSAGQRCSALRVLIVQEEIAEKTIAMLIGAMQELVVGNPAQYQSDIGPVIDHGALGPLFGHLQTMREQAAVLFQLPLPEGLTHGSFFPPSLVELKSLSQLSGEVFGPILHVLRYKADELDRIIDDVNATGYGLTLGIHTRIDATFNKIRQSVKVGNVYVNRNMIGAVVGVQPFGGTGLSGTGPKAGGPDYLRRFVTEQTVTINTAAIGGNAGLLAQDLR